MLHDVSMLQYSDTKHLVYIHKTLELCPRNFHYEFLETDPWIWWHDFKSPRI